MSTQPLPLSIIADVTVVTSAPQVAAPSFNTGLVIGSKTGAIPSYGPNSRVRKYLQGTWSTAMLADGFANTDPEYLAMQLYFGQSPPPQAGFVGFRDLTAISTFTVASGGTGYAIGDQFTVTQTGASHGIGTVIGVSAGVVTVAQILSGNQGTGYSVATGLATVAVAPSTGTGLTINITGIGESALQAAQACRLKEPTWYVFMVCGAVKQDHIDISNWVLGQVGTVYFGNTADADALAGSSTSVLKTLYSASSKRTWMQYATTQGGSYPNQAYFTAAIMGQAMASNTQLQNSSFTEKFSGGVPLLGVVTEPLAVYQIANIEGMVPAEGPNGNLFLNYANAYSILEQGTMEAELTFFDQVLGLDVLAANIQYNVMNLLTSVPKVPQTDSGQQTLVQAVERALQQSALTGFVAGGVWQGQTILTLTPGTALPLGYIVLTPTYATWGKSNPAKVAARQAPPIYVALIEAGAVHFVTIEVLVQV